MFLISVSGAETGFKIGGGGGGGGGVQVTVKANNIVSLFMKFGG